MILKRDAEQLAFIFEKGHTSKVKRNSSVFAMIVVYFVLQIVLVNLYFAIRVIKHLQ